jgi:hypothetical protein
MILLTRKLSILLSTILVSLALGAVTAQAGEPAAVTSERPLVSTELTRFLERAQPPAKPAPAANKNAPAASCEAASNQAEVLGTLREAEMKLAEMRKRQLAAWEAKGWTAKEAAAAGESVVLNGSGYNLKGALR